MAALTTAKVDPLKAAAQRWFGPSYEYDPVLWAKDKLDCYLWKVQREIAKAVVEHRYVAVHSAHDGGKSFIAALLSCWKIDVSVIGEAFLTSTAPTAAQVNAILWREIEKMHRKGKLKGRISTGGAPDWKIDKELVGYGRKPSDYDETGFQGIHALFPFIVVDEADGIPRQLWDAIDALATNDDARVLAIGNPGDPTSHFAKICKPGSGWHVIHLDGLLTPNFTEEAVKEYPKLYQYFLDHKIPFATEAVPDVLRKSLLSVRWVAERMDRWGVRRKDDGEWETPAIWEAKVRGKFSDTNQTGVIPYAWIEAAVTRWKLIYDAGGVPQGPRNIGVDVAREGEDDTVIALRSGHVIEKLLRYSKQDTMTTANIAAAQLNMRPGSSGYVDVIGVGGGVLDRLKELGLKVKPFDVTKATDMMDVTRTFVFANVYSAAWWNLRELLDPDLGATLCIPDDEDLIAELAAPGWEVGPKSKIKVEPNEKVKKTLGRSMDAATAVLACTWNGGFRGLANNFAVVKYGETTSEFHRVWDDAAAVANGW